MSEKERTPKEILAEIQVDLDSSVAAEREAALDALSELAYSSGTIMRMLERIALMDSSEAVRDKALQVLDMPVYRQIQARQSKLAEFSRRVVLKEIAAWEEDGLLDGMRAKVLRGRYNFDMRPVALEEKTAQPEPEPAKAELAAPKPVALKAEAPKPEEG